MRGSSSTDAPGGERTLVVGHEASRTGSVLQLASVVSEWAGTGHDVSVLLRRPGPLLTRFSELAPTTCLTPMHMGVPARRAVDRARLAGSFDAVSLVARRRLSANRPAYRQMLLNTVTHGDIIPWLPDVPTVVWVHEQRALIERLTSRRALRRLARPGCRLVAVSESVRADLVDLLPVRHEDIAVVPPSPAGWPAIDGAVARARLLSEIQATDDPFIVGACGALSWEKSPTGFLDLAETVAAQTGRRVHFAWLGEGRTPDIRRRLDEAASRRGLSCVTFLGAREEPGYFFAALDAFVVVSASDSFPVAALEAARDNTPVVCLADTGGIKEFVRDDAGIVVPGRDARRMAPDIRRLADDGSLCARMGAAGRARVQREHDPGLTAERLMRLFDGHARPPTTMND